LREEYRLRVFENKLLEENIWTEEGIREWRLEKTA
jgi:hypothetical protein